LQKVKHDGSSINLGDTSNPFGRFADGMVRKNGGRLSVVRIPRGILDAIDEFIETEQAKRLGLDSKSGVVSEAARQFLHKYRIL